MGQWKSTKCGLITSGISKPLVGTCSRGRRAQVDRKQQLYNKNVVLRQVRAYNDIGKQAE
jgi:hypothetical protein